MKKEEFNRIVGNLPQGSVKKACYIIREYQRCEASGEECAVTKDDYDSAILILLAHSYLTSDEKTTVDFYLCSSDCSKVDLYFCPGEFLIDNKTGKRLCKCFTDSSNI